MKRSSGITVAVLVGILILSALWLLKIDRSASLVNTEAGSDLVDTDEQGSSRFTDLAGTPFSFEEYAGSVIVVNSWATWSPFSKKDLALLSELAVTYKDSGVMFAAVNRAEDPAIIKAYLRSETVLTDHIKIVVDPNDGFYERIDGFAMPETVVYGSEGELLWKKRGVLDKNELVDILSESVTNVQTN